MIKIFVSNEFAEGNVLTEVIGSTVEKKSLILFNYGMDWQKKYLIPKEGLKVEGTVLELTANQAWELDTYQRVPYLNRVLIQDDIYGYICLNKTIENISGDEFFDLYRKNKVQRAAAKTDLHLLIPCSGPKDLEEVSNEYYVMESLKSQESLFSVDEVKESYCNFFIKKLKEYNNSELTGDFTRNINRKELGVLQFLIQIDKNEYTQYGFAYFSKHKYSEVGVVSFVFLNLSMPASMMLCALCQDIIYIWMDGKKVSVMDWLKQQNITAQGNPKGVVFQYSDLNKEELINDLACEYAPMAKINGHIFQEWSQENFAQYDTAQVYASDSCLVYHMNQMPERIHMRLNEQAIELFFLELILLQEGAVNLVCNKVYGYLNQDFGKNKSNTSQTLFELSKEAANAILFVDYDQLRYPTVRISARRIAQRFGINQGLEKYYKCREVLEQMISIDSFESDKVENKLMNMLLLILTMIQVLPTLVQIANSALTQQYSFTDFGSGLIGTMGCAIIYLIYRISYRRASKKSKARLLGKKR